MNGLALSIHPPVAEKHAKSKLEPFPVMSAGRKSFYFWIDNGAGRNPITISCVGPLMPVQ